MAVAQKAESLNIETNIQSRIRLLFAGRVGTLVKWFLAAYALNILIAIPFLLNRSSGTASAWNSFPLDDAWLHIDYVRSLVTQGCLCYNDGAWEGGAISWAWVLLLSPFYAIFHLGLGLPLVPLVKFVGLAVGALITVFVFIIARRVTRSQRVSIALAVLVALEPTFTFHRISGLEGVLVVAVVLGTTVALMNNRWWFAGLGMAIGFLARPEMALFLIPAYPVTLILWLRSSGPGPVQAFKKLAAARYSDNPGEETRGALSILIKGKGRLRDIAFALTLPLIVMAIWVSYNMWVNGTIYPNAYLLKHNITLPLIPIGNARNLFNALMVEWQPWLAGWKFPVTIVSYCFGSYYVLKRLGITAIPLLLSPLIIVFGASNSERYENPIIVFITRRHVDPTAPIIVLITLIGAWAVFEPYRSHIINRIQSINARAVRLTPVSLLVALAIVAVLPGTIGKWSKLTTDYSWNTQNVDEVNVEAGKWLKENTPDDAVILGFNAGALRYFSERKVIDVVGLNSFEFMGREHVDVVFTEEPDYIAIFSTPQYEQMPHAEQLANFDAPFNTILGFDEIGIWGLDWSPDIFAPTAVFTGVTVQGDVVDMVHPTDTENEEAHNYRVGFVSYAPRTAGNVNGFGVPILDRGVAMEGFEEFTVKTQPDTDLVLVLRYRATQGDPTFSSIAINGAIAQTISPNIDDLEIQEMSVRIPARFITADTVDVRIDWQMPITIFRWWSVIPRN